MICGRNAVLKFCAKLKTATLTCAATALAALTIGLKKRLSKIFVP